MNDALVIAMSEIKDGSMSKAISEAERDENRESFLARHGISSDQTVLVHLKYEGDDYRRYSTVRADEAGDGIVYESTIVADALFTKEKNLALLLPVADCIGMVLYDVKNEILGLAHLGRHNLLQHGGAEVIRYIQEHFASNPEDVRIWLSPAAGKASYPLHDFANKSMHEVAMEQLHEAGVLAQNITADERDTTTDPTLFSHSEFLKGNRESDGRQAVVAMMK